jgi:hypothetical protein
MSKPLVIYLDQNKWIDVARAYYQRKDGQEFIALLPKLQSATRNGSVILPLSHAHLYETRKIANVERRKRLAKIMVDLSQGWALAPNSYLIPKQIEVALDTMYGKTTSVFPEAISKSFFDFGFLDQICDELQIPKNGVLTIRRFLQLNRLEILEALFTGENADREIADFTNLASAKNLINDYVKSSERFRKVEKSTLNRVGRKRMYVIELAFHYRSVLDQLLVQRNSDLISFLKNNDVKRLMGFFADVPSLDIETELVIERNEHWDRSIQPNDIMDISFLSSAIPYCDVLVTEKFWTALIVRKGLDKKYKTKVSRNLLDLLAIIK